MTQTRARGGRLVCLYDNRTKEQAYTHITGMETKKEITKFMKYKRGTEIKAELKNIKNKFLNDLSELQNKCAEYYESLPIGDFFENKLISSVIRESLLIQKNIFDLDTKRAKDSIACSLITRNFTKRETEIFKILIKRHTAQYIANKLFISKRTVESHLRNMLIKISHDKMFSNIIENSKQFKEFDNEEEDTILRKPEKLLKFLYKTIES